jgi:hypothetical protein
MERGIEDSGGFACLADPEFACVTPLKEFQLSLEAQLKIHLLLSEYLLIPAGYFFDNPHLWKLISTDESFRRLLLAPTTMDSNKSTLILIRHKPKPGRQDDSLLDGFFRTWFAGSDGTRKIRPSSIRTEWTKHKPFEECNQIIAKMRKDWRNVTIKEYAKKLRLGGLLDAIHHIAYIHEKAFYIPTPKNRHALFHDYVREIAKEPGDFHGKRQLLNVINEKGRKSLERSEIQEKAPEAWKALRMQFIYSRHATYFANFNGNGRCSQLPDTTSFAEVDVNMREFIEKVEDSLGLMQVAEPVIKLEELTFEDILKIRESSQFMQSIRELNSIHSLETNKAQGCFVEIINKSWAPNLLNAVEDVQKSKNSSITTDVVIPKLTEAAFIAALGTYVGWKVIQSSLLRLLTTIAGPLGLIVGELLARVIHTRWFAPGPVKAAYLVIRNVKKIAFKESAVSGSRIRP